jgi:hypothetical protein
MNTTALAIDLIRLDGGIQPRAKINEETVEDYAAVWQAANGQYPFDKPCEVFHDGTDYWCADGFHRILGAARAKKASVQCVVHKGSARDAILYAAKCNSSHGLRRTAADKRHVVTKFLKDEEWSKRSSRWIAEVCDVSHTFVSAIRQELESVAKLPSVSTGNVASSHIKATGKDGKKRNVGTRKHEKKASVAEQIATAADDGEDESLEEMSVQEKCDADNRDIESFCRVLMAFFDDHVPDTVWIDSQGRVNSARSSIKAGCNTLRQSKSVLCPKCDEGRVRSGECGACKGYGYLPKIMADALGGK